MEQECPLAHSSRVALIAISTLVITACVPATPPEASAPAQVSPVADAPYSAIGTEPFWSLEITDNRITFQPMEGAATVANGFTSRPSLNGWRYTSDSVSVDVTDSPCNDGMSDNVYKDTVTVLVGTTEFRGCGGGALSTGASLANSQWQIVSVNGQDIYNPMGRGPLLVSFGKGEFSAATECNGVRGSYVAGDTWLYAPMVMSTLMACDGRLMAQERAIGAALSGHSVIRSNGEGTLFFGQDDGQIGLMRVGDCPDCNEMAGQAQLPDKPFDGEWDIRFIDSTAVTTERPYRMNFVDGQMSGFAGCNRFFGAFSMNDEALSLGPIGATKMACMGSGGQDEQRAFDILDGPLRYSFVDRYTILIGNAAGGLMLQRVH